MDEPNRGDYQNSKMCGHGGMCNHGGWCGCSGWHGGHHVGFHIIRWILGIFIILFVFSIGMKIGEFKGQIESSGDWGGRTHRYPMMQYGSMEQGAYGNAVYMVPATSATKTVKIQ